MLEYWKNGMMGPGKIGDGLFIPLQAG